MVCFCMRNCAEAYVAFDCIAGPGFKAFSSAVRDGGTIYNYGGQGGAELTVGESPRA